MKTSYLLPILPIALLMSACGSDSNSSSSSGTGAPSVTPPMEAALPASLKTTGTLLARILSKTSRGPSALTATATELTTCNEHGEASNTFSDPKETLAASIYCRLFGNGPIQVLSLTEAFDSRLSEVDSRIEGASEVPACLSGAVVDKSTDFPFPGQTGFTQKFQCMDQVDDNHFFAIGAEDTTWWMMDSQQNTGAQATSTGQSSAWKISADSDGNVLTEEGFITLSPLLDSSSNVGGSTLIMHAYVDASAGTVELAGMGHNIGFCAFHLKSDSDHIYVKGELNGAGGACDSERNICLSATDYSIVSDSNCSTLSAGLELTTLNRAAWTDPATDLAASTMTGGESVEFSTLNNFCPATITGVDSLF